jgi:hypothetical protein
VRFSVSSIQVSMRLAVAMSRWRKHVGENSIHAARDVQGCLDVQVRGTDQWGLRAVAAPRT